jgi:acetyl-CoA C-acetyltransferase
MPDFLKKRDVAIVGIGQTSFGEHWEIGLKELATQAGFDAAAEAGISGEDIEFVVIGNMSAGMFEGQEHLAALWADYLGLNPTPAIRVEAACASGGIALTQGYMAVASGFYDLVAVGGIEKMTDISGRGATTVLSGAMDVEWEAYFGATFPSVYALMARRYIHEYGLSREQLSEVAVKNHYYGSLNPKAHLRNRISIEDVVKSSLVSDPLRLFDCCPISDGAACLLLAPIEEAKRFTDTPVIIESISQASGTLSLFSRRDICTIDATIEASNKAFKVANLTRKDVDLVEVHDCFTIAEILALEDLGFCKKGEGSKLYEEGETYVGGRLPVNIDGGLKASGHPVGATGIKQVIEIVRQLRGEVEKGRQVDGAEIALSHNVGGSGSTVVVTILKRGD